MLERYFVRLYLATRNSILVSLCLIDALLNLCFVRGKATSLLEQNDEAVTFFKFFFAFGGSAASSKSKKLFTKRRFVRSFRDGPQEAKLWSFLCPYVLLRARYKVMLCNRSFFRSFFWKKKLRTKRLTTTKRSFVSRFVVVSRFVTQIKGLCAN